MCVLKAKHLIPVPKKSSRYLPNWICIKNKSSRHIRTEKAIKKKIPVKTVKFKIF